MREILFRGKSLYDKNFWIVGGIIHQTDYYGLPCDKWFIVDGAETYDYDIGEPYQVDSTTIGQYVGLDDETGKKIFEGDIIEYYHSLNNEKVRAVVEYENYSGWLPFTEEFGPYHESVKIIGNIHDNPELLKEKS